MPKKKRQHYDPRKTPEMRTAERRAWVQRSENPDMFADARDMWREEGFGKSGTGDWTLTIRGHTFKGSNKKPTRARWIRRRAILLLIGALGWWWYIAAPGVASYNIGGVIALPATIWVSFYLDALLPRPLAWIVAVAIPGVAIYLYLNHNPDRWWWPAQAACWPLLLLLLNKFWLNGSGDPPSTRRGPWLGGPIQGPMGPP